MDGDVASLVSEMMPYIMAAIGAYSTKVLAGVRDDAADATVEMGRRLLQKVFSSRDEGEPLPGLLAASVGVLGGDEALEAARQAVRQALDADPALAAEVRSILAGTSHVTQQATAMRDANVSYSTVVNYNYPHYAAGPASPGPQSARGRRRRAEGPSAASLRAATEAPRSRHRATRARSTAATTVVGALRRPRPSAVAAAAIVIVLVIVAPVLKALRTAPRPVLADAFSDPGGHIVGPVVFSQNGKTLAIGDSIGVTSIRSLTGRVIATLADPGSQGVYSLAFSQNGETLAAGDDNGRIYLWNGATQTYALSDPRSKGVNSVALQPDSDIIAACDGNGTTYLWNIVARRITATLPGFYGSSHDVYPQSAAFSPDGKTLAVAENSGTTYLWNLATRRDTPLEGLGSTNAKTVAFSPDGKILAVGDVNGTTYLWDLATDSPTLLPDPQGRGVQSVAFSPDGKTLAVGDRNGTTYLWTLPAS